MGKAWSEEEGWVNCALTLAAGCVGSTHVPGKPPIFLTWALFPHENDILRDVAAVSLR
jgi:hypothetical protein